MSEPKTYSLQEISLEVAAGLINCGGAGFYSYRCQAPLSHQQRMCVFASGRWWLIENGEFCIEDNGIVIVPEIPGGWTRAHLVEVDDDHPIVRLLLRDAEQDAGPDTPVPVSKILPYLPGKRTA